MKIIGKLHCVVFSIRDITNGKEYFTTDIDYLYRLFKDELKINQNVIFSDKLYTVQDIQIKNITNKPRLAHRYNSNREWLGKIDSTIRYNLRVHILIKEQLA